MTQDELNTIKSISITLDNAFAQNEIFWVKEIMASALTSLEALINRSGKSNEPVGDTPCPMCNPTGVFNYSPERDCICEGKAWIWGKKQ